MAGKLKRMIYLKNMNKKKGEFVSSSTEQKNMVWSSSWRHERQSCGAYVLVS
jgi:hypothetical protein